MAKSLATIQKTHQTKKTLSKGDEKGIQECAK
jgi:hypothetical protein